MIDKTMRKAVIIALTAAFAAALMLPLRSAASQTDDERKSKAVATLKDASSGDEPKFAAACFLIYLYSKKKDAAILVPLREALEISEGAGFPSTPRAVLGALHYQGIPDPLNPLVVSKLGSDNQEIREKAEMVALAGAKSARSGALYAALIRALKDKDRLDLVRITAARIIGESGRGSACDDLIAVLADTGLKELIRIKIIKGLGELGKEESVPHLINLLGDGSPVIRKGAALSLKRITFHDFGVSKKKWDTWWANNRGKKRFEWQRDFIQDLQSDRAEELLAELKTNPPLNTVSKVFRNSSSGLSPFDKFGRKYHELVEAAVKAMIKTPLKPEEFAGLAPYINELLASDDPRVRTAVLDYFTNKSANLPQHPGSIGPLLDAYLDPSETDAIKDRTLEAVAVVIGKVREGGELSLDKALEARLVAAMRDTAGDGRKQHQKRRETAVGILGAGLRNASGLMVLAELLKFDKELSNVKEEVDLRNTIASNINLALKGNGSLELAEPQRAELAAILGRIFLKDQKDVAANFTRPLANLGYAGRIKVEAKVYDGVTGLLAGGLSAGADRGIKEGVLEAFRKLNNDRSEEIVIAALKNKDVIDPNEKVIAPVETLAETALKTLGLIGGDKTLEYLSAAQVLNPNPAIKAVAWEALRDVTGRILAERRFEYLLGRDEAIRAAE